MKYKYYSIGESERDLRFAFSRAVSARLAALLDGKASGTTKTAIKHFVGQCMDDLTSIVVSSMCDALKDLDKRSEEMQDVESLERQKTALLKDLAQMKDKFSDPKAREAFRLYAEVMETGKNDNGYERCRRISAAGAIASAYLGLTSYGGGTKADNDPNE